MKLRTKSVLWMLSLLLIVVLNLFFVQSFIREVHQMGTAIGRNYDLTSRARALRDSLIDFHDAALLASLTRRVGDIERREHAAGEVRDLLREDKRADLDMSDQRDYARLGAKWEALLALAREEGGRGGKSPYLNPDYRQLYGSALEDVDNIVRNAQDDLLNEQKRDEEFVEDYTRLRLRLAILSLFILGVGFWVFQTQVISPLGAVQRFVQRLRSGDLSATWKGTSRDEIGAVGRTLEKMAQEIQLRRDERREIVASLVHDLKNPLTVISARCDLALAAYDKLSDSARRDAFGAIREQSLVLRRMTEEMLKLSSADAQLEATLSRETVDAGALLRSSLEAIQMTDTGHQYAYRQDDFEKPLAIEGDREALSRVFGNLLANAAKYSSQGTRIEVILSSSAEGGAVIQVIDQGVGIPLSQREKVFQPFKRLESGAAVAPGTGLGLAIVKRIVTLHGGSIQIEDRPGGGTIFRLEFPPVGSVPGLVVRNGDSASSPSLKGTTAG